MKRRIGMSALVVLALIPGILLLAELGGAHWLGLSAEGDKGVHWMVMTDNPQYRVLRVFAEPGATRRMHQHADATWHIITVTTGKIKLTVEGAPPVDVVAGQSTTLKGGVNHTFTNTGAETATLVEVFGKHTTQ